MVLVGLGIRNLLPSPRIISCAGTASSGGRTRRLPSSSLLDRKGSEQSPMNTTRCDGRLTETAAAVGADDPRGAILPLVPHLRAFARTLDADPAVADALVRDALVETLGDW